MTSRVARGYHRGQRGSLRAALYTILAIILIPAFFVGLYHWFRYMDCATATDQLEFLNACIASEHCNLRPHELNQIETYTRLQLARCPKD